jgi:hypothetical protein
VVFGGILRPMLLMLMIRGGIRGYNHVTHQHMEESFFDLRTGPISIDHPQKKDPFYRIQAM